MIRLQDSGIEVRRMRHPGRKSEEMYATVTSTAGEPEGNWDVSFESSRFMEVYYYRLLLSFGLSCLL